MKSNIPEFVPEYMSIKRESQRVMIRRRWFTLRHVPQIFFIIFLVFMFAPEVLKIENGAWAFIVIFIVGSWFLFVAGYVLVKLINSTYIKLTPEKISVTHKPLRLAKKLEINTKLIIKISQEQKRYSGRTRRKYYDLYAVTSNGEKLTLLSKIDVEAQALSIKMEIERFLENRVEH